MLATAHFERGSAYLKDPSEDAQRNACKDFTRALKGITKPVRALFASIFSVFVSTATTAVQEVSWPILCGRATSRTLESFVPSVAGQPRTTKVIHIVLRNVSSTR